MLHSVEEVREVRRVVESFPHFLRTWVWIADGGGLKLEPWPWQRRLECPLREGISVANVLMRKELG